MRKKEMNYQPNLYKTFLTKHNIFINGAGNEPNTGRRRVRIASRDDAGNERLMAGLPALVRTHG